MKSLKEEYKKKLIKMVQNLLINFFLNIFIKEFIMDTMLFILHGLELKGEEKCKETYSLERIDDAIKFKDNIYVNRLKIPYYVHNFNEIRKKRRENSHSIYDFINKGFDIEEFTLFIKNGIA